MSEKTSHGIWVGIFSLAFVGVEPARGQHDFTFTKTVDPSRRADFTTIQGAIDSITPLADRWTVLIYAGEYDEAVTLDEDDENIDLVGIDRGAVIINVTAAGSGIKITSGTETSRNNRIANLTIKTSNGHGIEIVKPQGAQTPKDIVIEGVTILADGTDQDGINASDADTVRIANCAIDSDDDDGIIVGDNFTIVDTIVTAGAANALGVWAHDTTGLNITNCNIDAQAVGVQLTGGNPPTNQVEVVGSEIRGEHRGVFIGTTGGNLRFRSCLIVAGEDLSTSTNVIGIYNDFEDADTSDFAVIGSRIEAIVPDVANPPGAVHAVQSDNTNNIRYIDCVIRAMSFEDDEALVVRGVRAGADGSITVIGGSIETSHVDLTTLANSAATDVFDLSNASQSAGNLFVNGTEFTKWLGPIDAAGRQRTVVQRLLNVVGKLPQRLVGNGDLDGNPITVGTPQLGTYRAIRVKWNNASGDDITVVAEGTNWAGDKIAEAFVLPIPGSCDPGPCIYEKEGDKPFNTVETIYIPDAPGNIDVGTTDKLGLYYPLSATTDVIQEGRLVSNVYTTQSVGTPDADFGTIIPSSALTAIPQSLEWMLLTSP